MSLANLYIVGGLLGSGKTTFLQEILNWDIDLSSTAILVNEFGQISIDGMLLNTKGSKLIELSSGCVCCSMQREFLRSLEDVLNERSPSRIFVETTGVADTLDIMALLKNSEVIKRVNLRRVVCVLDAELWEGKDAFGNVFFNQVKAADLILFNKVDLVAKDQVSPLMEEVREFNSTAMVVPAHHCKIDPEILLLGEGEESFARLDEIESLSEHGTGHDHDPAFTSFTFEEKNPLSESCFRTFMEQIPAHIFRVKGTVRFSQQAFVLNHVGGRSEWIESENSQGTKLVFIGWNIDADAVSVDLERCREESR